MQTTTHGEHLIQLTLFPRIFPVNLYLVRNEDGLTLIDTGIAGSAKGVLAAAQALGAPVRAIVLTHAHSDHIGGVDGLKRQLPDVPVIISSRDSRFLTGDMSLDPGEPQEQLRGAYQRITTTPDRLVQDGDRIGALEVVAAPGHTPGQIALLDRRDGTLIVGDALQTRGGLAVSGTMRWTFPFPAMATWSRTLAVESARRLRALGPSRLAVGHGEVLESPGAAMDAVIDEAERGLEREAARK